MKLRIKKLRVDAEIPKYHSKGAAAFDLHSAENYSLGPGETHIYKTGIAMEIPQGYAGFIWDRSGMGSKGIHRFAGVVDSDYRGEIGVVLFNSTNFEKEISKGDKIAQMVIQKHEQMEIQEVEELTPTERGEKGFGSTGK